MKSLLLGAVLIAATVAFFLARLFGLLHPSWLPEYFDLGLDFLLPSPMAIVGVVLLAYGIEQYRRQRKRKRGGQA